MASARPALLAWNGLALQAVRDTKPGPPIAARALSLMHTAGYDAWAPFDDSALQVRTNIPRKPPAQQTDQNRAVAISQACYRILLDQFSNGSAQWKSDLAAKLTQIGGDPSNASANPGNPVGVGNAAAAATITFGNGDHSNQLGTDPGSAGGPYSDTTGYVSKNSPMHLLLPAGDEAIADPAYWQPLSYLTPEGTVATPKYITPHWGNVTPFALSNGAEYRPGPPQSVLSQGFIDQARYVAQVQAELTPQQKVIAEFWADGPKSELPPGHWTLFATHVAERDDLSLSDTVKLFFVLCNAVADAAIAVWDCKLHYDYARPITAIRYLFRGRKLQAWGGPGKGTVELDGEAWRTFQVPTFPTPPFPEYVSGHSGFSMAAATVLKRFTGSDSFGAFYARSTPLAADPTEDIGGVVLSWPTFSAAAREAGESRLYGGIHFWEGNAAGLDLGVKVGNKAFAAALAKAKRLGAESVL